MTKTQYLQLNTWVDSDPVEVAQMNENFSILDQKSGYNIICSDAASINTSCLLLQAKRDGKDVSYAQRALLYDLTQLSDIAQHEFVYVTPTCTKIPVGDFTGVPNKYLKKNVSSVNSPLLFYSFQPSSYATFTGISLTFNGAYYDGSCSVEVRCGGSTLANSNTVTLNDAQSVSFPFNIALDPSKTYDLYFTSSTPIIAVLGDMTITAQPVTPASGTLTTIASAIAADTRRIVLHLHAQGPLPQLQLQYNGGTFQPALTPVSTGSAAFHRYDVALPTGVQSVAVKLTLSSTDTVLYGLCAALI